MKTVLFKGASDAMICTLVDYCKARRLDPLKKPFHIVKVYDQDEGRMVESIWPSIGELRTTAMRTGEYAGKSEIIFGPDVTKSLGGQNFEFPEWAQCTVYRMVKGQRVEFAGSRVYWLETYASKKGGGPNSMWAKRSRGQLAKCAEAEALRSAFPEESGSDPTAEEMEGQSIGSRNARDVTPPTIADRARAAAVPPADVMIVDPDGEERAVLPGEIANLVAGWCATCTAEELLCLVENNPDFDFIKVSVETELDVRSARERAKANPAALKTTAIGDDPLRIIADGKGLKEAIAILENAMRAADAGRADELLDAYRVKFASRPDLLDSLQGIVAEKIEDEFAADAVEPIKLGGDEA